MHAKPRSTIDREIRLDSAQRRCHLASSVSLVRLHHRTDEAAEKRVHVGAFVITSSTLYAQTPSHSVRHAITQGIYIFALKEVWKYSSTCTISPRYL